MMAAAAANRNLTDDEYRKMVIRKRPTPSARPLVALTLPPKGRKKGQRAI
jgi:hypothetical protein